MDATSRHKTTQAPGVGAAAVSHESARSRGPAAPQDSPVPVFDQAEALDRLDGEPELLVQVATVFLEDYPTTLADIGNSIDRKDADAVAFAAHKIKGGLGTLAARRAWAAAAVIERAGRESRFADARGALDDLRAQIDSVLPVLKTLVSEGVKA